jgi:hypothetical protein
MIIAIYQEDAGELAGTILQDVVDTCEEDPSEALKRWIDEKWLGEVEPEGLNYFVLDPSVGRKFLNIEVDTDSYEAAHVARATLYNLLKRFEKG